MTELTPKRHGGSCCGRYHIKEFKHPNMYKIDTQIERVEHILNNYSCGMSREPNENDDERELRYMCAEITLTQDQIKWKDSKGVTLLDRLKKLGFEVVYKFCNPNSLNTVYVLMYSENKED